MDVETYIPRPILGRPSEDHEASVDILADLATMMGFSKRLHKFPEGLQPDVYRFDASTRVIFIGEAKATEIPACAATMTRYQNYLNWLAASNATISASTCAICFRDVEAGAGWTKVLWDAVIASGLTLAHLEIWPLDSSHTVVWAKLG